MSRICLPEISVSVDMSRTFFNSPVIIMHLNELFLQMFTLHSFPLCVIQALVFQMHYDQWPNLDVKRHQNISWNALSKSCITQVKFC